MPQPPSLPSGRPLGHFHSAFFGDRLAMFAAAREIGPVVRLRILHRQMVTVTRPEVVRQVISDYESFSKDTNGNHTLTLIMGQGLVTIEHGRQWKRHRRMANPSFSKARLRSIAGVMNRAARDLCEATEPGVIETRGPMRDLALRIAGEALFTSDIAESADLITRAIDVCLPRMIDFSAVPLRSYPRLPSPGNRAFWRSAGELDDLVYGLIRARQGRQDHGEDLLGMLLDARDEAGEGMSERQIRDEVMTTLMAGHETVATSLTWALYFLSENPEVQEALHAEVAELDDGDVGLETFGRMPYTSGVIKETLRQRPPVWLIGRRTLKDEELGGYEVPADSPVTICTHALHHHPELWSEPERFDPERWHGKSPPSGQYLPFGAGPRKCIGDRFGTLELAVVLAHLVRAFRFESVVSEPPELVANISLRPKNPLPIRWVRRV